MKAIILFLSLVYVSPSVAGPYIELDMDYDPDPAYREHVRYVGQTDVVRERTRFESSNYVGVASTGWEWDTNNFLSNDDSVTIRLKVFEHRSDILNDGKEDIVNKNKIRGLSVRYRFW
jgi:hypothetical protein